MNGKLESIVMVGPVYPYKGGISHYTGLLYRALSAVYKVTMVSYSFQYPGFLYKKEQKDYGNDSFNIQETKYWLNTANPINWAVTAAKIKKMAPDLIIIQWWHPYFAPCYWSLAQFLHKEKILFICHNVFPHERFPFDRQLSRLVLKCGSGFIVQSGKDAEDLKKIVPDAVFEQVVHPTYNAFKFENISKEKARELLGLSKNEKILLFFGFIRDYKGLDILLNAMPSAACAVQKLKLLVVGDFGSEDNRRRYLNLIDTNHVGGYINIYDGYIPDREIEKFFAACDLVVLPYRSATQSGIVQIAYGFEKPVVVTKVGGLPDVVENGKTGYVVEMENPKQLAEAIACYFNDNREEEFTANVRNEAYRFSWDRIVEAIERLA